jgi:hypothetical protein
MALFQVFPQRKDLDLDFFDSLTWLVAIQLLEKVENSLLEKQGKACNSSQDVAIIWLDELLGLAHGNIAF